MGVYGTGIKDNDTSNDVYESFFEEYNNGLEVSKIKDKILTIYDGDINDMEHKCNVIFTLALCLWEVCELDDDLYKQVKSLIENDTDIDMLKELDATNKYISERKKVLNKFLDKMSIPREKAKLRKKPPVKIDSIYMPGSFLSFCYSNGDFGGVIIMKSDFFNNNGCMTLVLTDIRMKNAPTVNDFQKAKVLGFEWMGIGDSEGKSDNAIVSGESFDYFKSKQRESYFDLCKRIFTVVGRTFNTRDINTKHSKIYLCTSGGISSNGWGEICLDSDIIGSLDFYFKEDSEEKSDETIKELIPTFGTPID